MELSPFFFVLNHFLPDEHDDHVRASTVFAAALALKSARVATVLVVDGSRVADDGLRSTLEEMGARYLHLGRSLSFSEGYNEGLARSDQPWTILSASDVYSSPEVFDSVADLIDLVPSERIGCVIPQLSFSDLPYQEIRGRIRQVVSVPLMTLNFNVFETAYLRGIGGVPSEFTGNYNDVLLADRIKRDKREIYMVPAACIHYGSLTLKTGKSTVSSSGDEAKFASDYPELHDPGALWHVRLDAFTDSRRLRWISRAARPLPKRWKRRVTAHVPTLLFRWFNGRADGGS